MLHQLRKLHNSVPEGLLDSLPDVSFVVFEEHDWPDYIPYRLRIGTFHDPPSGAIDLPVWAYLRPTDRSRGLVSMELGAHNDLDAEYEETWELYYGNIRHDALESEPVRLTQPFSIEKSKSDLLALVKYYFLLAADGGMFPGRDIGFNESFAQSMRAICRRVVRQKEGPPLPAQSVIIKEDPEDRDTESIVVEDSISEGSTCKRSDSDMESDSDTDIERTQIDTESLRRNQDRIAKRYASQKLHKLFSDELGQGKVAAPNDNPRRPAIEAKTVSSMSEPISISEPSSASLAETTSLLISQAIIPTIAQLNTIRLRGEVLSSEIDELRRILTAKDAEKRVLDFKLYELAKREAIELSKKSREHIA